MIRPGLYPIADTARLAPDAFAPAVEAVLAGGAVMVQYRDKTEDDVRRAAQAETLVGLCRRYGAVSIINDDPELAAASGADGVHVGRDDADPAALRARIGANAIVGVSCYNELERARRAAAVGADYIAFGSVYPSSTKPDAVYAPLSLLSAAKAETGLPVCAIGGITEARAPELVTAGADLLAVIDDVFSAPDITARARAYARSWPTRARAEPAS
ncbi:MAG: thiamine phosphate synthase [Halofilum sp. (in: g-proteobacteria)]